MPVVLYALIFALLCGCTPASVVLEPAERTAGPTGIGGRVVDRQGRPAPGAFVYAYRNPRSGLRGPADFESRVDEDGSYFLDLAAGRYYLVARMRKGGADAGPPRPGDFWSLYQGNPVEVEEGRTSLADFILQGVAQPMLMRQGSLTSGDTGFTGRIADQQGEAVPGAFALAYRNGDFRRMPDFTSPAVGEDGIFTLYVAEPGRYCLAVRTRTRGQPVAGELYGLLGAGEGGCREVGKGELLELGTIVVAPYRH